MYEFHRLLAVHGRIYLNANGVGWYLKIIIDNPNATEDFSPRKMGYRAISDTINFRYSNQSLLGDEIIPSNLMKEFMSDIGFEIIYVGQVGTFINSCPDHEEDPEFFLENMTILNVSMKLSQSKFDIYDHKYPNKLI